MSNTARSTGVFATSPRSWLTWSSIWVYSDALGSLASGLGGGGVEASLGSHAGAPEGEAEAGTVETAGPVGGAEAEGVSIAWVPLGIAGDDVGFDEPHAPTTATTVARTAASGR